VAEIHTFPDITRVEQEAAEWIARLNAHDVRDEDLSRFAAWRDSHPLHGRIYDGMAAVWDALQSTDEPTEGLSVEHSGVELRPPIDRRWRRWILRVTLAASLLLVAGSYPRLAPLEPPEVAAPIFQTSLGEHVTISLPDRSTVELNSRSRIRVDYSRQQRRIEILQGEAFFSVAPEPSHPFTVIAGNSSVRVLGTAFGAYLSAAGMRVTVAQGSVQVAHSHDADTAVLKAGQVADVGSTFTSVRTVPDAEIARLLAWRSGRLTFENEPLGDVARELSRYTNAELVIADQALRQLEIGGSFPAGPQGTDALAHMLQDGFGLQVRREAGHIYIEFPPHASRH